MLTTKQFMWDAVNRTLIAEASDLRLQGWPHALEVQGARAKIQFNHFKTHSDAEGDVTHVEYHSTIGNFRMVIFND